MRGNDTGHLFDVHGQPTYHVDDPWTSKAAGKAAALNAGLLCTTVAILLAERHRAHAADPDVVPVGLTAYEVAQYLGDYATTAGTRIGELRAGEYVTYAVDGAGKRVHRPTDTGTPAEVHVITELGLKEVDALGAEYARTASQRRSKTMQAAGRTLERTPSRYGLKGVQNRILEELYLAGELGATDNELADLVGTLRGSIGGKRKQLVDRGDAMTTARSRVTPAGRAALVHVITDKGQRVLLAKARPAT